MWYSSAYRRHLCDMHIDDWDKSFLSKFSAEEYVNNLKLAKIQSAMIYLQSHVGHCYYPTKSGHMHGALEGREDMIKNLVDLCRKDGIFVTGYYSLIYNTYEHDKHAEWRLVEADGKSRRENEKLVCEDGFSNAAEARYGLCCPNNMEYREFVFSQIDEMLEYFDVDGMFYDMPFWPHFCYCENCRKRWAEEVGGELPFTFFGINPGVSRDEVRECLVNFAKGDNKLLDLSRAYKITLDTGWDVPPGVLHAPASLCTYEPQFASDVYAMYQSVLYGDHCVSEDLLWKNCPEEEKGNFDYLMEVIDWDKNVDPDFFENRFMAPKVVEANDAYIDEWICYKCELASAKRLTVMPGQTAIIKDAAAYGFILVQGKGTIEDWEMETPTLIRYGELTNDEFFVSEAAAKRGVRIVNTSKTEPIVMLKHFAENPDLEL